MLDDDGKEVPGTKGYKLVVLSLIFVLSMFINSILGTSDVQRSFLVSRSSFKVAQRRRRKRVKLRLFTKSSQVKALHILVI